MNITISNRSGVPIYEQIKIQIKESIISGTIKEDDALPSIRQLAKDLKISVITTTRAYRDLEEEGFVVSVQGKGCYVLPQNHDLFQEHALRGVEESLTNAMSIARGAGINKQELLDILTVLLEEDHYE